MLIGRILGEYMLILFLLIIFICSLLPIVDCCMVNDDKMRGMLGGVHQVVC